MEPIRIYGFSIADMLKQMYHGRNMPPVIVHGISNLEVLKFFAREFYREAFRPALVSLPLSAALLLGGSVGFEKTANLVNDYCKEGCRVSVGNLEVTYNPQPFQRNEQPKTIDNLTQ